MGVARCFCLAIALVVCGCTAALPTYRYRVRLVSPLGTTHGQWVVESASQPDIDADWNGRTSVWVDPGGGGMAGVRRAPTGITAPSGWLLVVSGPE